MDISEISSIRNRVYFNSFAHSLLLFADKKDCSDCRLGMLYLICPDQTFDHESLTTLNALNINASDIGHVCHNLLIQYTLN